MGLLRLAPEIQRHILSIPDMSAVYCPRVLGQWFDGIRF